MDMSIFIIRAILLAAIIYTSTVYAPLPWGQLANAVLGALLGAAIISLELRIRTVPAPQVAGGFIGHVLSTVSASIRQREELVPDGAGDPELHVQAHGLSPVADLSSVALVSR